MRVGLAGLFALGFAGFGAAFVVLASLAAGRVALRAGALRAEVAFLTAAFLGAGFALAIGFTLAFDFDFDAGFDFAIGFDCDLGAVVVRFAGAEGRRGAPMGFFGVGRVIARELLAAGLARREAPRAGAACRFATGRTLRCGLAVRFGSGLARPRTDEDFAADRTVAELRPAPLAAARAGFRDAAFAAGLATLRAGVASRAAVLAALRAGLATRVTALVVAFLAAAVLAAALLVAAFLAVAFVAVPLVAGVVAVFFAADRELDLVAGVALAAFLVGFAVVVAAFFVAAVVGGAVATVFDTASFTARRLGRVLAVGAVGVVEPGVVVVVIRAAPGSSETSSTGEVTGRDMAAP